MPARLIASLLAARLAVALPAALLAATALVAAPPAAAVATDGSAVLELVNASRAAAGLAPLMPDAGMAADSHDHAATMRAEGRLFHSPPRALDGAWAAFAENVGVGGDLRGVHAAFLGSASHRAAILGDYDRAGVGVARAGTRVYVVVQFGRLAAAPLPQPAELEWQVGFVDPATGRWHLPDDAGQPATFTYGNPGDAPLTGDWDCDGVDTPGLHRRSDGYVYLRNSNSTGIADTRYYFGNPGDVAVAGDFDGDGCDTVALYRPSTGVLHLIDRLGDGGRGVGVADRSVATGAGHAVPVAADVDGDGVDDVVLHDAAAAQVVTFTAGRVVRTAFGAPGDHLLAADWDGDGVATLASFRSRALHVGPGGSLAGTATPYPHAAPHWLPVVGEFGI